MTHLEIKDLHTQIEGKDILNGINLQINKGEIHTIMGPNGSGKSSLAMSLIGHPKYRVTKGIALLDNEDLLKMTSEERSKNGLFIAFQYPIAIQGVSVANFIRASYFAHNPNANINSFIKLLNSNMKKLGIDEEFIKKDINDGFSGGEKKKSEILQLAMLNPKIAILDEIDSGLDVDSLKVVSKMINLIKNDDMSIILITHHPNILEYIETSFIHVMSKGKIIKSGDALLAKQIEKDGYKKIIKDK